MTSKKKLAHVGDIKNSALMAHSLVFCGDPGELDGHFPTSKGGHFGILSDRQIVERGSSGNR